MLKTLFNTLLLLCLINSIQAQTKPVYYTDYSKIEGGEFQEAEFRFELKNGIMYINDLTYYRKSQYGPLKTDVNEYENGYYYEWFAPALKQNPDLGWEAKGVAIFVYCYTSKGGELIFIERGEYIDDKLFKKTFYTKKGYRLSNPYQSTSIKTKKIESTKPVFSGFHSIENIILSTSLAEMTSNVKMNFKSTENGKVSDDGESITFTYENNAEERALLSYSNSTGEILQITFILNRQKAKSITTKLMSKYYYDSYNEVIKGNSMTFDFRSNGNVGILVVR